MRAKFQLITALQLNEHLGGDFSMASLTNGLQNRYKGYVLDDPFNPDIVVQHGFINLPRRVGPLVARFL